MALKNYIAETDLEGFVPELDQYLFTGETDWSKQKTRAEQIVIADLVNKGFQLRNLRPELTLSTSTDSDEDVANRDRCVVVCTAFTSTAVVTVTGTNDTDDAYVTAGTSSNITATGTSSFLLDDRYKYYKYSNTGTATLTVFLVESSNYDLLFIYKWLELILRNSVVQENDAYHIKANWMRELYQNLWTSFSPFYDGDEDGEITASEKSNLTTMRINH